MTDPIDTMLTLIDGIATSIPDQTYRDLLQALTIVRGPMLPEAAALCSAARERNDIIREQNDTIRELHDTILEQNVTILEQNVTILEQNAIIRKLHDTLNSTVKAQQ
jgi:uncharacterized coiled-coil protein SlyX